MRILIRAINIWLCVRDRIDGFFRNRALRDLGLKITPDGSLYRDLHDVCWSQESHSTRAAAYFVIDRAYLPTVSPEDVRVMRAALEHPLADVHHGYVETQPNMRLAVVLAPGAAEALGWSEGCRIAFRRLYSGELMTRLDKRARGYPDDINTPANFCDRMG